MKEIIRKKAFMKKGGLKVKGISRGILLSGLLVFTTMAAGCGKEGNVISSDMITTIESGAFRERVNAEGTIECATPHYVYSTLTLPVEEIMVSEGDTVKAGDLLCVLDTKALEDQIALQEASMERAEKVATSNVQAAKHQYSVYCEGLSNGTDASLVSAMADMEAARAAYEKAQKAYDDYKEALSLGVDTTLMSADQSVARAATKLQQAKSMQSELDDEDDVSDLRKEEAEDAVDSASLAYVQAIQNRDSLLRESDILLANYAKQAEDANLNYIIAQTAYASAVRALENKKTASNDALNKALLSGDLSVEELQLAQLQNQMLDAQLISDYSGIVTSVNIKVGENSTGVLFVIEDMSDLVLTAKVSEKDINSVKEGMEVMVTTKSNNSGEYLGKVSKVASYTEKNPEGETDTSGNDAEFEVTVELDEPDENVRIGMNSNASFVVYDAQECFAVPNESVYTDEAGEKYILTVASDAEGGTVEKLPVIIKYKGHRDSVIEGSSLKQGMTVIVDAVTYIDMVGETVTIK